MANLNWVDFIFIAIFLFSMLKGFTKGVIGEVLSLATLIGAILIGILFTKPVANFILNYPFVADLLNQVSSTTGVNTEQPAYYLALGICFGLLFSIGVSIGAFITSFFSFAFQFGLIGIGNRLLGMGFGLIRGYLICLVIIFLVQVTPISEKAFWQHSVIVNRYQPGVSWLAQLVSPSLAEIKQKFNQEINSTDQLFRQGLNSLNH